MENKNQMLIEAHALSDAIRCGTANDELSMPVDTLNALAGMLLERMAALLETARE